METPTTGIQQKVNFVLWANKQYQLVRTNSQAYNIMQIQNRHLTSFPEEVRPAALRTLIGLLTIGCHIRITRYTRDLSLRASIYLGIHRHADGSH